MFQVEIITHAGPHRRLWMGPQFSFKTYTPPPSGEFSFDNIVTTNVNTMPTRSTPMNIEKSNKNVPVLIETVSTGSSDQSPRFMEELDRWGASHPHHPFLNIFSFLSLLILRCVTLLTEGDGFTCFLAPGVAFGTPTPR
ncbi:breast carcinoma-amplified sequence 3 homolog [Diaphorina citri]|uniref:Breast carcinoma-amplified sequence 3 homolog n=1 Tax=Diaphorina citri TaxID=121845 RepID=A0A3Q0JKT0_DIACI|nr:breast carcinoma-amplified sequence 3 homolog [Diaphorina citri]